MTKLLEKALKDAIKVKKCVVGTKQVMSSIKLHFNDTSVVLGRLCGLQYRVSTISLDSLTTSNTQAILKEYEQK